MEARLANLDDLAAVRLLTTIALPRLRQGDLQAELTPELRQTLAATFGVSAAAAPSEGDLARQTLIFLARDPAMQPVLTALLDGPEAAHFGKPQQKVAVAVAVLIALQTHLHIERDASGKWQFLVDHPTTSEEILKPIVQGLLGLPPEPPRLPR